MLRSFLPLQHGLAVVGLRHTRMWACFWHTGLISAVTLGFLHGGKMSLTRSYRRLDRASLSGGIFGSICLVGRFRPTRAGGYGVTTGSLTAGSRMDGGGNGSNLDLRLGRNHLPNGDSTRRRMTSPGIAIGLTLTMLILAGGPFTGASLNRARTSGPAIVAGNLQLRAALLCWNFWRRRVSRVIPYIRIAL
ncbi:MAG UNVERIFIED_CONTAM: aquaporin [Anaerolineae bacterium]|jgi:hypothetical protein